MVETIDCKQVLVALHGPDSLEAEVSLLGPFLLSEVRIFEDDVTCLIMSRNEMILELCFLLKALTVIGGNLVKGCLYCSSFGISFTNQRV